MRCTVRCWLFSPVLLYLAAGESLKCEDDSTQLLQSSNKLAQRSLEDLAAKLLTAKKECLMSSMECLPALKQVRYQVWPYIRHLVDSKVPQNAWEPTDFHAQVTNAQMSCNGDSNYTILYHHVWKAAGWPIMRNLEAISRSFKEVTSMEHDPRWCENLGFDLIDKKRLGTFTFVREPLARFISGYSEFEGHTHYEFLQQAEQGSLERAKLFMDRFFEDGAVNNGHVKPQSEYFAPVSATCSLPIEFVGKTESIFEDWKRFMESKKCEAANTLFNNDLGQHPTNGRLRQALSDFFNETQSFSALQQTASLSHLKSVLHSNGNAYLRAFCWLHLPDYVMFDYALPEKCNDPEMLTVMDLTKTA